MTGSILLLLILVPGPWQVSRTDGASAVHGRLLDEHGDPLAGWIIGALRDPWVGRKESEQARTGTDGSFAFPTSSRKRSRATSGGLALVVRRPDGGFMALREDFSLDGAEILLSLGPEDVTAGFIAVTLSGPHGEFLPGAEARERFRDGRPEAPVEESGGVFRIGPLVPGIHEIVVQAGVWPPSVSQVRVEAGAITTLVQHLEPPGRVVVSLRRGVVDLGRSPLRGVLWRDGVTRNGSLRLDAVEARRETVDTCMGPDPGDSWRPDELAPGRYLLRTRDRCCAAADVLFEVRSGETSSITVDLEPATMRTVIVRVPSTDPAIRMMLTVRSESGPISWRAECTFRGKRNSFVFDVPGLRLGRYRIEARSPAGTVLEGRLEVTDLGPAEPLFLEP